MSTEFSLSSLMSVAPHDLTVGAATTPEKVHQIAKTMEGVFVGQLMAEMSKSIGTSDNSKESSTYHDFIQQAMTQQVSTGSGFGLAPVIERYLNEKIKATSEKTTSSEK